MNMKTHTTPKVLSYGGGLDSFAMLLDAIARNELPDVVAFVDVGDPNDRSVPGEWPSTYRHIEDVVRPVCTDAGIEFVVIDSNTYPVRDAGSLFGWLWDRNQIPVSGPNRICTIVSKVERFEAWLADRFGDQPVEVWIGFEAGEERRAENDPNAGKGKSTQRQNRFPLIERGLCRCRCEAIVAKAGHPIPRKSACVFCPYGSKRDWQTFAAQLPDQFARVAEMERRKPPTAANGIKLSIMGFKSDKLTWSQAKALNEFRRNRFAAVHGGTRKALLARNLIDAGGRLTPEGLKAQAVGKGYTVGYKAPPLAEYIQGEAKRPIVPCGVCGRNMKASKATGCGYLGEAA